MGILVSNTPQYLHADAVMNVFMRCQNRIVIDPFYRLAANRSTVLVLLINLSQQTKLHEKKYIGK